MGNKSLRKRKYDRTRDDTCQIEQRKDLYRRKKQERANIEEINDDNVNIDFQQEEVQPGMHTDMMIKHMTHWDCIHKVQNSKYRIQIKNIVNNIIDCNYNLMFFKKHK
jgi:hypothetical protein